MKSNRQDIAIFDFDGTISRQDSFLAFIAFTHGRLRLYWGLFLHLPILLLFLIKRYPNYLLKEKIFTYFYRTYPVDKLKEQAHLFGKQLDQICYHGALELLDWHQTQAHRILILTASSPIWLGAWCDLKQYEIIGTEFDIQNGVYTGKIAGKNCYGVEKLNRINSILDQGCGKIYAYGDSKADLYFLKRANESYLMPLSSSNIRQFWGTDKIYPGRHYRLLQWCYILLFTLLPFSLPMGSSTQIELPTEPLLTLCSVGLLLWFVRYGWWERAFYYHPLSLASIAFLGWMGLCIPFSSNWIVSLKYWIVAATHWWVFYHGLRLVLPEGISDFLSLLKKYTFSFTLILLYAWTVHAQYDFRIDASVLAARPFYFDHAMYGAVLLMLIAPVLWFGKRVNTYTKNITNWQGIGWSVIMLLGIYLSYSRAAWLSGFLALGLVLIVYLFSLKFKHLLLLSTLFLLGLVAMAPFLSEQLNNNQAESKTGSLWEQLASTANITTDVSNLERLNRYSCALRMTKDRAWTGFGPGTFQFAYLSYQKPEEMTRISVTTVEKHRAGKGGGAHSEYLQYFAEMGIIGGLLWLGIVISTFWAIINLYHRSKQTILLAILFGLTSFFVHAMFNNFLHHGKVVVLVWSNLALINILWIKNSERTIG